MTGKSKIILSISALSTIFGLGQFSCNKRANRASLSRDEIFSFR